MASWLTQSWRNANMPVYPFINSESKEVRHIYIPITGQVTVYNGENGLETGVWKRDYSDYSTVNFGMQTRIDPYSNKSFISATEKNMTMGEMMDLSQEMSDKRKDKEGIDPVKQKYRKDYERRNGVKSLDEIQEAKKKKVKDSMDKLGFSIEE